MLINAGKNKKLDYFGSTSFYLFSVLALIIGQFFAGVVSAALSKTVPDIAENGDFNTACMIFFQLVNAAFIFLYLRLKKTAPNFSLVRNTEAGRGVTAAIVIIPVVAAAVLMIGMYLPTTWYGYLTQVMGISPDAGSIDIKTPSAVVMLVIASVILAPIFEETIYRGVLLHGLKQERSAVAAVLLSALAFMLMHLNPLQVVFQFVLGAVAAVIVLRTKRLLPSIILHASSNALALVVEFTPFAAVLGGCISWLTAHVAAAFFITLGLFVAAGGVLFVLIRFGLKEKRVEGYVPVVETEETENLQEASVTEEVIQTEEAVNADVANTSEVPAEGCAETVAPDADASAMQAQRAQEAKRYHKRDGTIRFYVGISICVFMFIVNLVTLIIAPYITL